MGSAAALSGKTVSARAVGLASKSSRARPSRRFGGRWWGPGLSPPEYFGLVEIGWAEAGPVGDQAAAVDGASCEDGGGGDAVVIIPGAGPRLPLTSTVRPNSVTATITMFCNTWGASSCSKAARVSSRQVSNQASRSSAPLPFVGVPAMERRHSNAMAVRKSVIEAGIGPIVKGILSYIDVSVNPGSGSFGNSWSAGPAVPRARGHAPLVCANSHPVTL